MISLKYNIETHLDDPLTTVKHRDIILQKKFLKKIYEDWYKLFVDEVKRNPNGKFLEIGSGGGFLKDLLPEVVTSDILPLPNVDKEFSAEEMPFNDMELDGIFMVNVLHHIPHPYKFFKEAERTLKPGGKIIMVEPANTPVARFIYQHFHHEPFVPEGGWEINSSGPLSGANGGIPWIYLVRDRKKFESEFPHLKIELIEPHTAFRYLISGGVSRKALVPLWSYGFWNYIEKFPGINKLFGMLGTYILIKK